MKFFTARLDRKKAALAVILAGALLAALLLFLGREPEDAVVPPQQLSSCEEQVAYLQSLGWEVSPEPLETLQFLLPDRLTGTYLAYNELQDAQGFDLSACCGKQLTRYTYAVSNYPGRPEGVQLNLYVCEDRAVAGDVCCPGPDGFQSTLVYPEANS